MAAGTSDQAPAPSERRDWKAEYRDLLAQDRVAPLDPAGLERLATAAYLAGDEPGSVEAHTRNHEAALQAGDLRRAARAALWIGSALIGSRELTHAAGWVARARRLLEQSGQDCVECGYVMLMQARAHVARGELAEAYKAFAGAEEIGERFSHTDLVSLARQGRGRVLVGLGHVADGAALFDEVMVAVTAGELTPITAGAVYCSVISACFEMLDIRRAHEWTDALNAWCAAQPGLVPYRGECLAHRAELLCLHGHWPDALAEARRAYDSLLAAGSPSRGAGAYALAELHRLRGETAAAEKAYLLASEHGRAPHPGLALLRLAQGDDLAARAAIERMAAEPTRGRQHADVLAAAVEIFLASGDLPAAERASDELKALAGAVGSIWVQAMAAMAAGAIHLAAERPREALAPLREALVIWDDLDVPYDAARVRVLVGRACRALGDVDGARMEWDAAARAFRACGAAPALTALESVSHEASVAQARGGGLTSRELEVLRLVARGKTNRAIARDLAISEKTVARHVSNIFTKLDLCTRAAATAYAFTHQLVS